MSGRLGAWTARPDRTSFLALVAQKCVSRTPTINFRVGDFFSRRRNFGGWGFFSRAYDFCMRIFLENKSGESQSSECDAFRSRRRGLPEAMASKMAASLSPSVATRTATVDDESSLPPRGESTPV